MDYKEAIYHFRKFAIQHGFIEEYKKYCNWGLFGKKGVKDIPSHLKYAEPVKYIQNESFFCHWPNGNESKIDWRTMSRKWAKYCMDNGIYYNFKFAKEYIDEYIHYVVVDD